jgi:glyoxylase-like metal-dependent hydrolase (beta-lactamase superfamily II)
MPPAGKRAAAAARKDWDREGAVEVADGTYRIPLQLPEDALKAVNAYLIKDSGGPVVIDPGWAIGPARERLERELRRLGITLPSIRRFLVTHVHRDHYTQAVALRREFGTPISLGIGEEPSLGALMRPKAEPYAGVITRLRRAGADQLAGRLGPMSEPRELKDFEKPDEWLRAPADIKLADRTLTAMPTPGHTQGHVVFYEPGARLLFAGDHVLPHITPSISFEPVSAQAPLRDYMDSLRLLRLIPDTRLLPAHGPVTDSTRARVEELLEHHDLRLEQMRAAVQPGASTAWEVARQVTWTRHRRSVGSLDDFNQMMAVLETESHLQLLASEGRLHVSHVDGKNCYEAEPSHYDFSG